MHDSVELPAPNSATPSYNIYFICGNPGLISYYDTFLHKLHHEINTLLTRRGLPGALVSGDSLGGFELVSAHGPSKNLFSLQQQIDHVETSLTFKFSKQQAHHVTNVATLTRDIPKVVLIGHSVGAYILLEIIRRFRSAERDRQPKCTIVAGICLFPTIIDIAQSPSGRRLGWLLVRFPYFAQLIGAVARLLTWLVPEQVIESIVKRVTDFPDQGVKTTTALLRSKTGVSQALYMARDEMRQITSDKWDQDVWGSATPPSPALKPSKLFFYFGVGDHWVADRTRDDIIAARALQKGTDETWKPVMAVDELGIPHAFAMRHSTPVVRKIVGYLENIITADKQSL